MSAGRSIDELGVTLSWFELRSWLRYPPQGSWYAKARAAQAAEEAKPAEQRIVGGRSDALPFDELDKFIGW